MRGLRGGLWLQSVLVLVPACSLGHADPPLSNPSGNVPDMQQQQEEERGTVPSGGEHDGMLSADLSVLDERLPELVACFDHASGGTHDQQRIEIVMTLDADGRVGTVGAVVATATDTTVACVTAAIREWGFAPGQPRRHSYGIEMDSTGIRRGGISW
jgi:hypothetical protein